MIATLRTFSILLCYPTSGIRDGAGELASALRSEGLVSGPLLDRLLAFIADYGARDLYDLQERYVLLFDRTRSLSLHLFEHVHGESRDRGPAMVDLLGLYRQQGLEIGAPELPDYLPMFLEFVSTLPLPRARAMLVEILHIVSVLEERLGKRRSGYAAVLAGVAAVARDGRDIAADGDLSPLADDDPNDLDSLDQAWEDKPVTFGPDAAAAAGTACPQMRDMLAGLDPSVSADGSVPEQVMSRWKETPEWTP